MTTTPGLRERNRIRTRDDILVAVSELLGEQDLGQMTVEDVAGRAGISRGTIYAYFPDGRDQLVRDAYVRMASLVAGRGAAEHDRASTTAGRIMALAEALVEAAVTPAGRFYAVLGPDITPVVRGVVGSTSRGFQDQVAADLRRAVETGELAESLPIEAMAVSITGAMRAIGRAAADDPGRSAQLLEAIRWICGALPAVPRYDP